MNAYCTECNKESEMKVSMFSAAMQTLVVQEKWNIGIVVVCPECSKREVMCTQDSGEENEKAKTTTH